MIEPNTTVNEVLRKWPATAGIINRYGLDMCCGGGLTLAVAAVSAGADLQHLLKDLHEAATD